MVTSSPTDEPPGDLLTDQDQHADPVEVAKQIILKQLSHSPKTRYQLAQVLAKRNVSPDAAAAALDRIAELGYIDDAAFARAWVESRHRSRGLAHSVLRRELTQRGVDRDLIEEALVEGVSVESERAVARALVDKKLRSMTGVADDAATRRLVGMLNRKGYSPGVAFAVVREALAATRG